ncbi:MAG: DUF3261 domain-containing protein [Candidatus Obscuribacterales bacterium]|nr:DUF3261 domain-containing protein [Steroidobacteraceae bacterium]
MLILLVLMLTACTAVRPPDTSSRPLLAPSALRANRAGNQIVRGAFGAREITLNCVLTVRGDNLTVVGLTAMGVRAFTIRYDGRQVIVENELPIPAQLTPERLLADIQLVFWPTAALQSQFTSAGWQLTEPFANTRRLRRHDSLIAEVHYDSSDPWQGRSWLVNLEHGYTLSIESTPLAAP